MFILLFFSFSQDDRDELLAKKIEEAYVLNNENIEESQDEVNCLTKEIVDQPTDNSLKRLRVFLLKSIEKLKKTKSQILMLKAWLEQKKKLEKELNNEIKEYYI